MNEWKVLKLGDVGKVAMCKRVLKSETSAHGEIPFYKISTFGGNADSYISKDLFTKYLNAYPFPKKGDILISAAGTLGKTVIYDGAPAYFQDSNIVWIANDESKILNAFLYYYFQTKPWQTTSGSTINRIYNEDLRCLDVRHPDLSSQNKIAAVLATLDEKIELNQRINSELEGMAKLLYDYWFVQFDFPMSASQAAALGKPEFAGKPYSSSGGKMVYNENLKRKIPEGWTDQAISCMISSDKAGDWGQEHAVGNYQTEVYCIRGTDLDSLNGIRPTTPPRRFILGKNELKILKPNDLIIEISGGSPTQSTGRASALLKPAFARFDKPLICSNFCKALSLKPDSSVFFFYRTWDRLYDAGVFFNWEGKTSGIKNLLFDSFVRNHRIVNADREITKRFDQVLTPFEEVKQANLIQNQELTQLRDWLLPMLMNGQVKVG